MSALRMLTWPAIVLTVCAAIAVMTLTELETVGPALDAAAERAGASPVSDPQPTRRSAALAARRGEPRVVSPGGHR
jgi:hypothetical protein